MNPSSFLFPYRALGGLAALQVLASCAPTVKLSTPDPVKIDVNMNVHVTTEQVKKTVDGEEAGKSPRQAQRERMAEVQALKNNRIIGEANTGMLEVKEPPADPAYQAYVRRVVEEENRDRQTLLNTEAEARKMPASTVARDYARRKREAAFAGEWIQQEDGSWLKR